MLPPLAWTHFHHRGDADGNPIAEAVPIYGCVQDAIEGLKSIIKHHDERLAHAHSNRRFQMGQSIFGDQIPNWGRTHLFYRGHESIKYDVLPTLLRLNRDRESTLTDICQRQQSLNAVLHRLDELSGTKSDFAFLKDLSSAQREALARHYGCPSSMLDVSTSIDVAAHFATRSAKRQAPEKDLGILFAFNLLDILNLSGMTQSGPTDNGVGYRFTPIGRVSRQMLVFESPQRAHWENYDIYFSRERTFTLSFEFVYVPGIHRIDVQQAAFFSANYAIGQEPENQQDSDPLAVVAAWEIIQAFSYKACFVQSGQAYTSFLPDSNGDCIYPADHVTNQMDSIINEKLNRVRTVIADRPYHTT
jgi:hypothetical protein